MSANVIRLEELGHGATGCVYKAVHATSLQLLAVKEVKSYPPSLTPPPPLYTEPVVSGRAVIDFGTAASRGSTHEVDPCRRKHMRHHDALLGGTTLVSCFMFRSHSCRWYDLCLDAPGKYQPNQ